MSASGREQIESPECRKLASSNSVLRLGELRFRELHLPGACSRF